jgi:hypothetical protein
VRDIHDEGRRLLRIVRRGTGRRWRRAGGDRREQLKWLACGGAVAAVSLILAAALGVAGLLAPVGVPPP